MGQDDTERPRSSKFTWDDDQGYLEITPPYALRPTLSDLATARQLILHIIAGDDVEDQLAAGLIDQALAALCPHDSGMRHCSIADSGEEIITCIACNVSWYTGERV